jgi:hypothetical protein
MKALPAKKMALTQSPGDTETRSGSCLRNRISFFKFSEYILAHRNNPATHAEYSAMLFFNAVFNQGQPMELVPKSKPNIFFIVSFKVSQNYFIFAYRLLKANHNKDYSVVKTFKSPRLPIRGFFFPTLHKLFVRSKQ